MLKTVEKIIGRRRKNGRRAKSVRLGLCTCVRNERAYLREWIAHYRKLGFEFIFVYDNESSDSSVPLLDKLAAEDLKVIPWPTQPGKSPQLSAFEHCANLAASICDFVAFFDADEFLFEQSEGSLRRVLAEIDDTTDGILINQRVVGSNGARTFRPLPVVRRFPAVTGESYQENEWVKCVVRPKSVQMFGNPHVPKTERGAFVTGAGKRLSEGQLHLDGRLTTVDHSNLALNHYILKSHEEFLWKRARGGGATATPELRAKGYADDQFFINRQLAIEKWELKPVRADSRPEDVLRRELIDELKMVPIPWNEKQAVLSRKQREWVLDRLASQDSIVHFGVSQAVIDAVNAGISNIVVVSSSSKAIEVLRSTAAVEAAIKVGRLRAIHADIGPVDDYGYPLKPSTPDALRNYAQCAWNAPSNTPPTLSGPSLVIDTGRFRVACACFAALKNHASKILLRDFAERSNIRQCWNFSRFKN